MSVPPPEGWQPPQQPGTPPNHGQPYGQAGYYSQQPPPPPGWQQGNWPQQSGPPPKKGGSLKWLLVGVAVLLVIGITVGATLLFTHDNGGATTTPTSGVASDIASASDKGPVSIITDEPTCDTFMGINDNLATIEAKGWSERRNGLASAEEWSEDDRTQVQAVATAISNAADQMVTLAKRTPHRLIRELYEQSLLYGRLYAESVPTYTPKNNALADVFVNGSSAIAGICNTIDNGAASRSIALAPSSPPSRTAEVRDPSKPDRFITTVDEFCTAWVDRERKFIDETADWATLDASIPASNWSAEQSAKQLAILPTLKAYADDIEGAGRASANPVTEDFASTSALYIRAYAASMSDYTNADSWLIYTAFRLSNTVSGACQAAS